MLFTLRGFGGTRSGLPRLIVWGMFAMTTASAVVAAEPAAKPPHVVFISGDEEYRSEESLPMLAKILDKTHGFRVSVCYALDPDGSINPDNLTNIAGLEASTTPTWWSCSPGSASCPTTSLRGSSSTPRAASR